MKKYSYTFVVDDINISGNFYEKYFGWMAKNKSETFAIIDTDSPLAFSIVDKDYLLQILNITEEEISERSFCTWIYESNDELQSKKAELLEKGMIQIGNKGHFLKDGEGMIWELRMRGDGI